MFTPPPDPRAILAHTLYQLRVTWAAELGYAVRDRMGDEDMRAVADFVAGVIPDTPPRLDCLTPWDGDTKDMLTVLDLLLQVWCRLAHGDWTTYDADAHRSLEGIRDLMGRVVVFRLFPLPLLPPSKPKRP